MSFDRYAERYTDHFRSEEFQVAAHAATGGICCWCGWAKSSTIHHAAYGKGDKVGEWLFPLCDWCHSKSNPRGVHARRYWIKDRKDPVWGNHNLPLALRQLRKNYQRLNQCTTQIPSCWRI